MPPARVISVETPTRGPTTITRSSRGVTVPNFAQRLTTTRPPRATKTKKAFSLVRTMSARPDSVGAEPARVVRGAEIFPKQPQAERRPHGEEAVDEGVLRKMDLQRRCGAEGEGGQTGAASHHARRGDANEDDGENRGRGGDAVQGEANGIGWQVLGGGLADWHARRKRPGGQDSR